MAVERFPVEASHILMFARSIGDSNPIYADESHAAGTEVGSIIAPPTFAQASAQFDPDYFLRPKDGQRWFGSGGTASGTLVKEKNMNRQDLIIGLFYQVKEIILTHI